jgi:hypothetical protein
MRDVVDVLVSKARWRKKSKIRPSTSAERIRQPKRATDR